MLTPPPSSTPSSARSDSPGSGSPPTGDRDPRLAVFYRVAYVGGSFDTLAKAGPIADLIRAAGSDAGSVLVAPAAATEDELLRVHDQEYVDAVLTGAPEHLAMSAGLGWDEAMVAAVLASTGGCREAARRAWVDGVSGTLSSGLHHARSHTERTAA